MRLASTSRRRGTVTIIVVSFLLLLLLMGLSFAFYGLREAEETRVYRDSQNGGQTGVGPVTRGSSNPDQPPEPDVIFNNAIASVLYGAPDDLRGAYNVLRQHEIARSMYGWNPKYPSPYYGYNAALPAPFPPPDPSQAAIAPFNGYGRVRPGSDILPNCNPPLPANAALDNMINFAWVPGLLPGGVMLDIDNNYARNPTNAATNPQQFQYLPKTATNPAFPDRYWAKNANYTYPDLNNVFLGALDASSGKVLMPSYHRPYLIQGALPPNMPGGALTIDPNNDWTNSLGRLKILRPRPVDHQWPANSGLSDFPYPTDAGGDVKNLDGAPGGNDSYWMDLDLPVGYWRGKWYKPLVAFLILDLDGRINLNTAGNFYRDPTSPPAPAPYLAVHGSNQGVGGWEVNPSKVMKYYPPTVAPNPPPPPVDRIDEAANLTLGTTNPNLLNLGGQVSPVTAHARYGLTWIGANPSWSPRLPYYPYIPSAIPILNMPPPGSGAHFYGGVDLDGRRGVTAPMGSEQISANDAQGHFTTYTFGPPFVGTPGNPNDPPRPDYSSRYGSGYYVTDQNGNPVCDERTDHPMLYNPYIVRSRPSLNLQPSPGNNIPNRTFGVEEIRFLTAKYNYDNYTNSQLARLAPSTLGNAAVRLGQLNPRFATTVLSNDFDLPGIAPANLGTYQYTPAQIGQPLAQPKPPGPAQQISPSSLAPTGGNYDDSFRSLVAKLGPVDLHRKLTDYRANINKPLGPNNAGNVSRALADRQLLAHDIFFRLCVVAGLMQPNSFTPLAGDVTQRWFAQLAVNIVDYIDVDDCITPFKWTDQKGGDGFNNAGNNLDNEQTNNLQNYNTTIKNDWVFGFERPRVNVNETYLRVENDPNDTFPVDTNDGKKKASTFYNMLMWLEMHNPVTPASAAEQFSGIEGYPDPAAAPDDSIHGGYRATLKDTFQAGERSAYRVLVYKTVQPTGNDRMGMRPRPGDDNVAGLPTNAQTTFLSNVRFDKANDAQNIVDDSGGTIIQPNVSAQQPNAGYRDASFYLAGPQIDQQGGAGKATIPGGQAGAQANLTTKALQAQVQLNEFVPNAQDPTQSRTTWAPGFILQRLACPALPPGQFNPYVTIDYWESDPIAVGNRLKYDQDGNTPNTMTPGTEPDFNTTYSWGRRQPYDGVVKQNVANQGSYRQDPNGLPATGTPHHTLGQHNGKGTAPGTNQWPQQGDATLELPFWPMVHLDRILLNPTELMHVTALKPYEVTHEYSESPDWNVQPGAVNTFNTRLLTNGRLRYTVDWLDHGPQGQPGSYLYRAFDFIRPSSFHMGLGMGGRIPGKVNINTIFNKEVFDAVFDAQSANRFVQSPNGTNLSVDEAWSNLVADPQYGRTPNLAGGLITQNDKPLWGTAAPIVDGTTGLPIDRYRTLVRPDMVWNQTDVANKGSEKYTPGPSPAGHAGALEKYEMLSKVYNQFTTRSNCYAVYMTVGYFEVRNPGPYDINNRPVLGKELGTDDGTVTRNKYFSVIDRTNLSIEYNAPVAVGATLPPIKQGQPPVYFSYQPFTPLPAAPAWAVSGTEDPVPNGQPSQIKIPATGVNALNQVMGYYDGNLWTIQPNISQLMIDIGDKQEAVTVTAASYDAVTASAVLTISPLTVQHSRGASIRLTNPDWTQPPSTPGHPGPQPGFNYKSPRYAPVVKYVEQLK